MKPWIKPVLVGLAASVLFAAAGDRLIVQDKLATFAEWARQTAQRLERIETKIDKLLEGNHDR